VVVVTGSLGYIGKYIARVLLDRGEVVRTITTHPGKPNPFGSSIQAFPYHFDNPELLTDQLRGAQTLYNTYWIRFPYDGKTFEDAVRNTRTLFACARTAGVRKIVHISVTNASADSPLPYYRGKGEQESLLVESGVEYSIVRPTLVFGKEDILVNNIGWLIRHFPFFPIFGNGGYRLQPVFVEDLAHISVDATRLPSGTILDAIGPETYTFDQFISIITKSVGSRCRPIRIPPALGIAFGKLIGLAVGDVVLTTDELRGLMCNYLSSNQPPNCPTRFSRWLEENKDFLGTRYSSEIRRHFRWSQPKSEIK